MKSQKKKAEFSTEKSHVIQRTKFEILGKSPNFRTLNLKTLLTCTFFFCFFCFFLILFSLFFFHSFCFFFSEIMIVGEEREKMGEGLGRTKGEEGEEIESREVNPDGENPLIQSRRGVWMVGMTYLITIGVIFLLVLGKNVPYHPQKFVYEYFLEHTFFRFDPFTHIIISVDPQPNVGEFSYLSYLGATSIGGPLLFLFYGLLFCFVLFDFLFDFFLIFF